MNKPLLIENLFKSYGPVKAVNGVNLELQEGEIFGLLGPNGAGKTSIISCVVTLEKATSGQISIFGEKVGDATQRAQSKVGIVPQEVVNHGFFSIYEILEFQSGYYGISNNKERIEELLHELQLFEHREKKVKQLSGGMKRRLMIAKALVHKPRLLLLDEPTAGVDIELRSHLWKFVQKLKQQGVTVLLTTHYLEEAQELCDRVAVINRGEIVALDKTQSLIRGLTDRTLKIKFHGQEDYKTYTMKSGEALGQYLEKNKIDPLQIDDLSIEDGKLETAVRRLLNEKNNPAKSTEALP
ncbi:MAG: ABC transporter ATP-binding protein [Bdellovibrionota bacterium]